jgi:predicted NAD/FAD-binding protein
MSSQPPITRVAVVGSGIAGLTAAWVLSRDNRFEVTLIEREPSLGMDAHSFDMSHAQPGGSAGSPQRLDMPLRVFSESYYPNLTRLYSEAGVTFCPEDYCGSFLDADGSCLFKYSNLLIGPFSLPWIFPRFLLKRASLSLAIEYFRFMVVARRHTKDGSLWLKALETMTFGEYLQRGMYSATFVNKFIVRSQIVTIRPHPIPFFTDALHHVIASPRSQFPAQFAPAAPLPSFPIPPTSSSPICASDPSVV